MDSRLGSARWRQLAHGWHVPAEVTETVAQRIVQSTTIVPEGRLSGWAAAYVLGADALDGRDPFTGARQPVRLVLDPGAAQRHVPGTRCVRAGLEEASVVTEHGFRVTSALQTTEDLAREAANLTEAVVALDVLVRAGSRTPTGRRGRDRRVRRRSRRRQARAAAVLCRAGVRSPWETRLRLFVLGLGLPEPLINVPVFDLDGNFLGAPDLLDGERGGLVVARADSLDLTLHRAELDRRLRAARADALRHRRPVRWTLVEPSWWRGMPA